MILRKSGANAMNAALAGTKRRVLVASVPAILVLLGWQGFPNSAAASEVTVLPWFSPRLVVTDEDFPSRVVGIGPGMSSPELIASHAVFSLGSRSDLPTSAQRLAAEQSDETQRSEMPTGAKITRDQAIAIALKRVPGRASSVEVEQKLGKLVYTVEVIPPSGTETDVFVDVVSGEVVGTEQ
jgi:Peptidase propeptide and YPEB domain